MRVVIDTNVFVSFLLTPGKTISSIRFGWKEGYFTVLVSDEMLVELKQVLERLVAKKILAKNAALALLRRAKKETVKIPTISTIHISSDPSDNRFLACCQDGQADFLVTGDTKHLLLLGKIAKTSIVSPKEFVQILNDSKRS